MDKPDFEKMYLTPKVALSMGKEEGIKVHDFKFPVSCAMTSISKNALPIFLGI